MINDADYLFIPQWPSACLLQKNIFLWFDWFIFIIEILIHLFSSWNKHFFSVMFWVINMLYWPHHLYFINSTLPCSMKNQSICKRMKAMKVKVAQLCPTLCNRMHSTVHGIFQARILEWVAYPFSSRSSWPRSRTRVSWVAGGFLTNWAMRDAHGCGPIKKKKINTEI